MATFKKYVLYIGHDHRNASVFCPGSKAAMELVKSLGEDALVQNVDVLLEKGVDLPEWLDGTPVLVNMETKQALKGSEAVKYLQNLSKPPPDEDHAPTMEEMQGVLPGGESYLHGESDNFTPSEPQQSHIMNRDDKITDADLEAYMKLRNPDGVPAAVQA